MSDTPVEADPNPPGPSVTEVEDDDETGHETSHEDDDETGRE